MTKRKVKPLLYYIITALAAFAATGLIIVLSGVGTPLSVVIRASALLGYQALFLAVLSSMFLRQIVRSFGRSFIQVHHVVSVAGLILITIHPLAAALRSESAGVFLPRFDSLRVFLELGGRPALYLIYLAALAALLRLQMRGSWRVIHLLNYLAFVLVSIHAVLIGTDFGPVLRAVAIVLVVSVLVIFVAKRVARARRMARGGR